MGDNMPESVLWDLMAAGDGAGSMVMGGPVAGACATPSPVLARVGAFTPSPPYLRLSTTADDAAALSTPDVFESWAPSADLDVFFTRLYALYYERGFPVFATRRITSLLYVPLARDRDPVGASRVWFV